MPVPAAPTDFTLTPLATGSPLSTAAWTHPGADRFEIKKRVGGGGWERVILAPAADFGTAPNFSFVVVASEAAEFVVRAMNADGEVSV